VTFGKPGAVNLGPFVGVDYYKWSISHYTGYRRGDGFHSIIPTKPDLSPPHPCTSPHPLCRNNDCRNSNCRNNVCIPRWRTWNEFTRSINLLLLLYCWQTMENFEKNYYYNLTKLWLWSDQSNCDTHWKYENKTMKKYRMLLVELAYNEVWAWCYCICVITTSYNLIGSGLKRLGMAREKQCMHLNYQITQKGWIKARFK